MKAVDFILLHPAPWLDGALQGLFGLVADRRHQIQGGRPFSRWRVWPSFASQRTFGRGSPPRFAAIDRGPGVRSVSADIVLSDEAGGRGCPSSRVIAGSGGLS